MDGNNDPPKPRKAPLEFDIGVDKDCPDRVTMLMTLRLHPRDAASIASELTRCVKEIAQSAILIVPAGGMPKPH